MNVRSNESWLAGARLSRLGAHVQTLEEVDSTNALLLRSAAALPDGSVAIAALQSAGRGRLGRRWHANPGASVLLSTLLHEPAESPLRTSAAWLAALAATEALDEFTAGVGLRWPNDLVHGGRKLGGVLAEATPLAPQRIALVVGVGVNVAQSEADFPPELCGHATSLHIISGRLLDRFAVARRIVEQVDRALALAATVHGRFALQRAFAERCADRGSRVELRCDGHEYSGVVREITDAGDLLVELADGERRCFDAATTTRLWTHTPRPRE